LIVRPKVANRIKAILINFFFADSNEINLYVKSKQADPLTLSKASA
jgi:hypothetical protein